MKRLPTKEEYETLLTYLQSWNEDWSERTFMRKNKNSITFQAKGFISETNLGLLSLESDGFYLTSTKDDALIPQFSGIWVFRLQYYFPPYMRLISAQARYSVRLVSDEPCEGYVDMGDGIYWAKENYKEGEKEYFTYEEALKIYEK